jgi:hypothetical protein
MRHHFKGNRIYFSDNLRTFMIFLVVLYHAGGVYESSGIWASFRIFYAVIYGKEERMGISKIQIRKTYHSLDCSCFNPNSTLQNYIFILSEFTSRKLDDLLSLEQRNLESKLAVVSTGSFFIRHIVFTPLKSQHKNIKYYLDESPLGNLSHRLCL